MRISFLLIVLGAISCSPIDSIKVSGKWYTYAESGDYMELWIGEDRAMSYLSSIDEFLLYDMVRRGDTLSFTLIESRVMNSHEFQLKLLKREPDLLQAMFISSTKIDSLKTYFLISNVVPNLAASLHENDDNMQELFSRLEGSHAGHGH